MAQDRLAALEAMAEAQPGEALVWYGLANEYTKLARWEEAATALRRLLKIDPNYTSAYQMLGSALINLGEREEARSVWTEGVAVATRTGAWKARQHLEGLLAGSRTADESGLCAE
ncbi:MAG TPA: tetratricopeptide repeat protein [Pyrinomonadaceae bacterium]|nr:tetratricopeptide repeat protein [Pyrinomonadaceae bacterium]